VFADLVVAVLRRADRGKDHIDLGLVAGDLRPCSIACPNCEDEFLVVAATVQERGSLAVSVGDLVCQDALVVEDHRCQLCQLLDNQVCATTAVLGGEFVLGLADFVAERRTDSVVRTGRVSEVAGEIGAGDRHDERDREPEQHGAARGAHAGLFPERPGGDEADLPGVGGGWSGSGGHHRRSRTPCGPSSRSTSASASRWRRRESGAGIRSRAAMAGGAVRRATTPGVPRGNAVRESKRGYNCRSRRIGSRSATVDEAERAPLPTTV